MMSAPSLTLEKQLFLTAKPGLAALIIVAALSLIAGLTGRAQIERIESAQAAFLEKKVSALDAWRSTLAKLEAGEIKPAPYAARPMDIDMPAVLPPAPLADFSAASAGLYPTTAVINGWSNPADLFAAYEYGNPQLLALGGFDLSFVVVVVIPLIMIAVSFDILPGERQDGRIRLVSVQAGHIGQSTWSRLIIRCAALWAVFAIITACLTLLPGRDHALAGRVSAYALWLAIACLYGLFWFAMIAAANIAIKRADAVAAALFAAWAIFVFAVPTLGSAIAEAAYPPPSRLAYLSQMRQGEVAAIRDTAALTAGFLADHPELTVSDDAVPAYYSANFLANQEAARRTTPVLEAFERSRASRSALTGWLQYLSPAMIIDKSLKRVASGDIDRYMAFQSQAIDALHAFRDAIGPSVVAKQRLSLAAFDQIERFGFKEDTLAALFASRLAPLSYLLIIAIGLLLYSKQRLAKPLEKIL